MAEKISAVTGDEIAATFASMGITHVIAVPDSTLGPWHAAIRAHPALKLVSVCREGEAWAIAGGLQLGGAKPLVLIQCTGFFESGDSLRNIVWDWKLPIFSVIGYRSYLSQETLPGDTCLVFTEPLATAWRLDWKLVTERAQLAEFATHYADCMKRGVAGAIIVAEGRA
jgi:hypothetical protein